MRFSRQGYWSGLSFPSPGDLPNPGFEPGSPALQADSLLTELRGIGSIYFLFGWARSWLQHAGSLVTACGFLVP